MPIDALVPIGGTHAIQGMAFVVGWSVELTESELNRIEKLHEKLSALLPMVQRVEMMSLRVDAQPRQAYGYNKNKKKADDRRPTHQSQSLDAVHFLQVDEANHGRPLRVVQANKSNLAVIVHDYQNWAEACAFLRTVLGQILAVVVNGRPISSAMLQYTDAFTWKDEPSRLDWKEVFKADAMYIPKSAFEHEGLWHSHHGYTEERVEVLPHLLTENLNVDVVQQNAYKVINIFTSHNALLRSGAWTVAAAEGVVAGLFEDFHERNKTLLRRLLTDEVLMRIGLLVDQK